MLTLIGEISGVALDLLEKNGVLFPFCRARDVNQKILIIAADDPGKDDESEVTQEELLRGVESIRIELKRRIAASEILEFAICSDNIIKLQGEPKERRFLKVEFQNGTEETGIYFFPLSLENGKAQVGSYLVADVREKLL